MKILGKRVLVTRELVEEKSSGGILLGFSPIPSEDTGIVKLISSNCPPENEDLKEGVKVLFRKNSGVPMNVDGEDCVLLLEESIMGILN